MPNIKQLRANIKPSKKGECFTLENLKVKTKYLMSDTERVQDFQRKIYRKAKQGDQRKCKLYNQRDFKILNL